MVQRQALGSWSYWRCFSAWLLLVQLDNSPWGEEEQTEVEQVLLEEKT
jgi:hypothetical protein